MPAIIACICSVSACRAAFRAKPTLHGRCPTCEAAYRTKRRASAAERHRNNQRRHPDGDETCGRAAIHAARTAGMSEFRREG